MRWFSWLFGRKNKEAQQAESEFKAQIKEALLQGNDLIKAAERLREQSERRRDSRLSVTGYYPPMEHQ
jgi:hypothetical protein